MNTKGLISIGLILIWGVGCTKNPVFSSFGDLESIIPMIPTFPEQECASSDVVLRPSFDTQNPIHFDNLGIQKLDVVMTQAETICAWNGSKDDQPPWLQVKPSPLSGLGNQTIEMSPMKANATANELLSNLQLDVDYKSLSSVDQEGRKFHTVMDSCGLTINAGGSKEIDFDVDGNLVNSPDISFQGNQCNWQFKVSYINDSNWVGTFDSNEVQTFFADSKTPVAVNPDVDTVLSSLVIASSNSAGTIGRNAVLQISSNYTTKIQIPIHQDGPSGTDCQIISAMAKQKLTYFNSDTEGAVQVELAGQNCGWNASLDSLGTDWIGGIQKMDPVLSIGKQMIHFSFTSPLISDRVGQITIQSNSQNSGSTVPSTFQFQLEQVQAPPCKIVLRNPHPSIYSNADQLPENVTVAAQAGASCNWTLSSPDASDWITGISLVSGSQMYNQQVAFHLLQNATGSSRTGHIVISNASDGASAWNYAITIDQSSDADPLPGPSSSVSPNPPDPSASPSVKMFTVTPAGSHVTISPSSPQSVAQDLTATFKVVSDDGFVLSQNIGGSCPTGSWNLGSYTTGLIEQSCDLSFSVTDLILTVTASGQNVSISPSAVQSVKYKANAAFQVTPNKGYTIDSSQVGGTCPGGSWDLSGKVPVYTTGSVTKSCTVDIHVNPSAITVTAFGNNATVQPSGQISATLGGQMNFTASPSTGYFLNGMVSSNGKTPVCPGTFTATSNGAKFVAGPLIQDCSVVFNAGLLGYQVAGTASQSTIAGSLVDSVTISPSLQTVSSGGTASLAVSPNPGFTTPISVSGNCTANGQGVDAVSGGTYVTGAIQQDCALLFSGTLQNLQVTASGPNMVISNSGGTPASSITVGASYDAQVTFKVTPNATYMLSTKIGGTCPLGSWDSETSPTTYVTGPITGTCTVIFDDFLDPSGQSIVVDAVGDAGVSVNAPTRVTVSPGATATFTPSVAPGYLLSSAIGGTCPTTPWSGSGSYSTGVITSSFAPSCQVKFSTQPQLLSVRLLNSNTVSVSKVSVGGAGPSYSVPYNSSIAFTLNAQTGNTLSQALQMGSDCPRGSWNKNVYTTGNITSNCSIGFTSTVQNFTVNATGLNVSATPNSEVVSYNKAATFNVVPALGYSLQQPTGTCPLNGLGWDSNNNYSTGQITKNCTINFSANLISYNVTILAGPGAQLNLPSVTTQSVALGQTASFSGISALPGYSISSIDDLCFGNFDSSTGIYTSGTVSQNCTVTFNTQPINYTVTAVVDNASHAIVTPQTISVPYNQTATISAVGSPANGYTISSVNDTCPNQGSWNSTAGTYTTGPVTQDCGLTFTTQAINYPVTASGDNHVAVQPATQSIGYGQNAPITIQLDPGFDLGPITDTCAQQSSTNGSLNSNQTKYKSGTVVGKCAVKMTSTPSPCTCTIAAASGAPSGSCSSNLNNNNYIVGASYQVDTSTNTSMTIMYLANSEKHHALDLCSDSQPVVTISGPNCSYQITNTSQECNPNTSKFINNIKTSNSISNGKTTIPYSYAQWINLYNKNNPFTKSHTGISIGPSPSSGTVGNTCTVYILGNSAPTGPP